MYTQCNTDNELDALFVFCSFNDAMDAFEAIRKLQYFAKIVTTPKSVFPAESLSIAVKKKELGIIGEKLTERGIAPIKTVSLERCVFSYYYSV